MAIGQVPAANSPIVTGDGQTPSSAWYRFWASFNSAPGAAQTVAVGASPFSYTANANGVLIVSGGMVSAIAVTRGRVTVSAGVIAGAIPVSTGDLIKVTYSVLPTMTFLPN